MIKLNFTKMHGLGNDFIVINSLNQAFDVAALPIAQLADRHRGIGFDQALIIEPSATADFFCRIFNADGSEAAQCGNGLRCVARFLHENALTQAKQLSIETQAGIFPIVFDDYQQIQVTLSVPTIIEKLVTLPGCETEMLPVSLLMLGNPHAILRLPEQSPLSLENAAATISAHSTFSDGANVGFMDIVDANHIRLRTFERGVGETNACGSNACAAVVAGMLNGWLDDEVQVEFKQGSLNIKWQGLGQPVQMRGPAERIYEGVVEV